MTSTACQVHAHAFLHCSGTRHQAQTQQCCTKIGAATIPTSTSVAWQGAEAPQGPVTLLSPPVVTGHLIASALPLAAPSAATFAWSRQALQLTCAVAAEPCKMMGMPCETSQASTSQEAWTRPSRRPTRPPRRWAPHSRCWCTSPRRVAKCAAAAAIRALEPPPVRPVLACTIARASHCTPALERPKADIT